MRLIVAAVCVALFTGSVNAKTFHHSHRVTTVHSMVQGLGIGLKHMLDSAIRLSHKNRN